MHNEIFCFQSSAVQRDCITSKFASDNRSDMKDVIKQVDMATRLKLLKEVRERIIEIISNYFQAKKEG